jgi:hypothetical protein
LFAIEGEDKNANANALKNAPAVLSEAQSVLSMRARAGLTPKWLAEIASLLHCRVQQVDDS